MSSPLQLLRDFLALYGFGARSPRRRQPLIQIGRANRSRLA